VTLPRGPLSSWRSAGLTLQPEFVEDVDVDDVDGSVKMNPEFFGRYRLGKGFNVSPFYVHRPNLSVTIQMLTGTCHSNILIAYGAPVRTTDGQENLCYIIPSFHTCFEFGSVLARVRRSSASNGIIAVLRANIIGCVPLSQPHARRLRTYASLLTARVRAITDFDLSVTGSLAKVYVAF
jgi:hypothetical protein